MSDSIPGGAPGAPAPPPAPPADAAPAPPPAPGAFAVGSACFCAHQSNWYKARVRQVAGDGGRRRYLVHYDGWNARTDAWVDGAALRAADYDFGPAAAAEPAAAGGGAAPAAPPAKRRKRGAAAAPAAPAAAPADGGGARLRLPLPRELRDVLVRDWEQVTREPRHWPALPRSPTVAELLAGFVDGKAAAAPGAQAAKWRDVGAALLAYFDACLPKLLLYRQEREQWASRAARGATPAALYGAEHLLRLLSLIHI